MAIFGTAKENTSKVIIRPRITEKAASMTENNNPAYVFEVHPSANKQMVKEAIKDLYKVNPIRINIVKNPAKTVSRRGRLGKTKGVVKAIVFLKKGETIEIV